MKRWPRIKRENGTITKSVLESAIQIVTESGCWIWMGPCDNGYGRAKCGKKHIYVHRISYEIYNGKIPDDKDVLHRCDNPPCVNPHHLFLGTQRDNNLDRMRKKRHGDIKGEKHPFAKLTNNDIMKIRCDNRPQRAIAKDYGVTQPLIGYIKRREIWTHI